MRIEKAYYINWDHDEADYIIPATFHNYTLKSR